MKKILLLAVLKNPGFSVRLTLSQWDLLIRQARSSNLLAKLYAVLKKNNLLNSIPPQALRHLESDWTAFKSHQRTILWEAKQIQSALKELKVKVIFLKGAAYLLGSLPVGEGRIFSDTDILVPKNRIDEVEKALLMRGWAPDKKDDYDQQYYRLWMHEIPPLRHVKRKTVLDVHHNILPGTVKHVPDHNKLIEKMNPFAGKKNFGLLCPADMVLHSAVHLFHEGELDNGFRDLTDLDSLLRDFGQSDNFWSILVSRGEALNVNRSLFYGLKLTKQIFDTPIPKDIHKAVSPHAPLWPLSPIMIFLYMNALLPNHPSCNTIFTLFSKRLLYIRSHYIRMPLKLLIPHLFRKMIKKQKLQANFWHLKQ